MALVSRFALLVLMVAQWLLPVAFLGADSAFAGSIMNPKTADQLFRENLAASAKPAPEFEGVTNPASSAGAPSTTSASEAPSGPCPTNTDDFKTDGWTNISTLLKGCRPDRVITANGDDYGYTTGARDRVIQLANQIIAVGALLSIGAIVYAGFIYTTSMGDDERIKTGKNALKFGIIGFVVMLISFPLVNAIVKLFYDIGG